MPSLSDFFNKPLVGDFTWGDAASTAVDLFNTYQTGRNLQNANQQVQGGYNQGISSLQNIGAGTRDFLGNQYNQTAGQIGDIYGGTRQDLHGLYQLGKGDVSRAFRLGESNINNAIGGAQSAVRGAADTRFLNPYLNAGEEATSQYMNLLSNPEQVYNDPGYAFLKGEGQRGLERGAAARGYNLSGNVLQDLSQWNQDYAASKYGDYLGYRTPMVQAGLQASNTAAGLRQAQMGAEASLGSAAASQQGALSRQLMGEYGGLNRDYAGNLSNLGMNEASALSGLSQNYMGNVANVDRTLMQQLPDMYVGRGEAQGAEDVLQAGTTSDYLKTGLGALQKLGQFGNIGGAGATGAGAAGEIMSGSDLGLTGADSGSMFMVGQDGLIQQLPSVTGGAAGAAGAAGSVMTGSDIGMTGAGADSLFMVGADGFIQPLSGGSALTSAGATSSAVPAAGGAAPIAGQMATLGPAALFAGAIAAGQIFGEDDTWGADITNNVDRLVNQSGDTSPQNYVNTFSQLLTQNPEYGNPNGTLTGKGERAVMDFLGRKDWLSKDIVQSTPYLRDTVNGIDPATAYHAGNMGPNNIYYSVGRYSTNPDNLAAFDLAQTDRRVNKYGGDKGATTSGLYYQQRMAENQAETLGLDPDRLRRNA